MSGLVVLACLYACGTSPMSAQDAAAFDAAAPDAALDAPASNDGGGGVHRALFIGNSYVFTHDVAGRYEQMVAVTGAPSEIRQVVYGGYNWTQHVADLASPAAEISIALTRDNMLDFVILQEQSLRGGVPLHDDPRRRLASVAAARELSRRASEAGARIVLYQTWGRRDGLEGESFQRMSTWLAQNYVVLAQALERDGADVVVAPVGIAFHIVHDDVLASGGDPASPSSPFFALYEADGSHPSVQGAYLAACVIAGASTGAPAASFPDAPDLDSGVSGSLRSVCQRALNDPRLGRPRPRVLDLGDDVDIRPLVSGGEVAAWSGNGRRAFVDGDGVRRLFEMVDERWVEDEAWMEAGISTIAVALNETGDVIVGGGALLGVARRLDERWEREELPHERPPGMFAISGNGRVIAVGRSLFSDEDHAVLASIYEYSGDRWRMTSQVEGSAGAQTRPNLKLDGPGATLLISERNGGVRVMARMEDGWRQEAVLMEGLASIWLSSDGARALTYSAGRLVLFERIAGAWSRSSTDSHLWEFSPFGSGFGVSSDLRTIIASGRHIFRPEEEGALHVLRWSEGGFVETHLLFAGAVFDRFPSSVHISADAQLAVTGSPPALFELPSSRDE